MSCGVGHRHSSELVLLWLWSRPVATTPIRPLSLGTSIYHGCSPKKKDKRQKIKIKNIQYCLISFQSYPITLSANSLYRCQNYLLLKRKRGIPVMAQQKWIWLASMRMRVWSLVSLSGLRIWHCHKLWWRSQMLLGAALEKQTNKEEKGGGE